MSCLGKTLLRIPIISLFKIAFVPYGHSRGSYWCIYIGVRKGWLSDSFSQWDLLLRGPLVEREA